MADTNIAKYISQITSDRDRLKTFVKEELGGTIASPEKLQNIVDWFVGTETLEAGFIIRDNPAATVVEGSSYTIQPGYYKGGTITGVAGGGNYSLQDKSVTPTKSTQTINSDESYYGLGTVTVNPIPDAYQVVTNVTAVAADVLTGKVIVDATGAEITGTMANNGAISATLDTTTTSYTVPKGYHNGSGIVNVVLETKTVTPEENAVTVTPTAGKVLSTVTVNPIPDNYIAVDTASEVSLDTAQYVLSGLSLYGRDAEGNPALVEGTANKYASKAVVLDATKTGDTYVNTVADIEKGFHEAGTVSIDVQDKVVTSSNVAQTVEPDAGKVLGKVTVNAMAAGTLSDIALDSTSGLITAKVGTAGYLAAGTSKTLQLTTQAGKTITPATTAQTAVPAGAYTLGTVTVAAIPANFGDVSTATVAAEDVLAGKVAFGKDTNGNAISIVGTMANNGTLSLTFDPLTETSVAIAKGYTDGGTVVLTSDLETALAAI